MVFATYLQDTQGILQVEHCSAVAMWLEALVVATSKSAFCFAGHEGVWA